MGKNVALLPQSVRFPATYVFLSYDTSLMFFSLVSAKKSFQQSLVFFLTHLLYGSIVSCRPIGNTTLGLQRWGYSNGKGIPEENVKGEDTNTTVVWLGYVSESARRVPWSG